MQIAILGAGFCGLAVAWHLTQIGVRKIIIFDPQGIGQGASGVAAGLLHPFAGLHAKKSPQADQGMVASLHLLSIAEKALYTPIILKKGLVRLAINEQQKADFAMTASLYPEDVHWLTAEACQSKLGYTGSYPGIFIESAVVVDSEKYLKGLWTACAKEGVVLEKRAIQSLREVDHFDLTIVAMGATAKKLPELSHIKVNPIKGQILELHWPEGIYSPLFPISSQGYLITKEEGKKCILGATYERNYHTEAPDREKALREILPKWNPFFPQLNASLVVGCRSGVRASTPSHQPILEKVNEKTWLLTGMGSKGLLYHALYAKKLVTLLEKETKSLLDS